jgi:beta-xylosidase
MTSSILVVTLACLLGRVQSINSTYNNPILPGFHPDPSCISVPEHPYDWTFFCASSSFSVFPGIPIHASKDLVDWKLVSNAISRPEQLPDLAITNKSTSGIWAPALRYHDGVFYILSTLVFDDQPSTNDSKWDNFIITSTDPFDSLSWSDPVHFPFVGYDTSPFWDDDGNTYVTGSHTWEVYPAIKQATIDLKTGKVGEYVDIWNGTGGEAPEGPHIYKKDDWYYLMIAEGGTGLNHEEDIARSRSLFGPYDNGVDPATPIVTQANTSSYFQTVGHADVFQDRQGHWWGVALSTRSGPEYQVYPMGRETVLAPVSWPNGGWPVWTNISGTMNGWQLPPRQLIREGEGPLITAPDEIDFAPGTSLPPQLVHWRLPIARNYIVSPRGHRNSLQLTSSVLNLTGYDGNYAGPAGQTFISRRQVDTFFTFSVTLDYSDLSALEDEAGVSVFLVQNHHFDLGVVMLPLHASSEGSSTVDPTSTASTSYATGANTFTLAPHFRFRGISYQPVPPEIVIPVNDTWLDQPLTLEIKAFNYTHYSLSAGPAAHQHLLQTIAYAPAAAVSFGFTG